MAENTRIIIVTIQTFPFVLDAIQQQTSLRDRRFAVIADEAHSSQSGKTANKVRQVLMADQLDEDAEAFADAFSTPNRPRTSSATIPVLP